MLQKTKSGTVIDEIEPLPAHQAGLGELVEWAFGLLRRQLFVILFVAALGLAGGIFYLTITPPVYTAQTSVYIDLHKNPIDQQAGIFGNDPIEIASQIQIIKSKTIASLVIKKLELLNDPEFGSAAPSPSHVSSILFGTYRQPTSATESDLTDRAIIAFENSLSVEPVGGRVVVIGFSSTNPTRAATIANAVANAYITDQLDAKYEANRVATDWLQKRQEQLQQQADGAQRAVEAFKKQNNIVTNDGKPLDNIQMAELNTRLVAARAQTSDLLARLTRLQAIVRLGPSNTHIEGAISDINSPIATTLRQQYLELGRRESEWSVRYGKDHLAVVSLRNRMQEMRGSLFDELQRAAETAKNDYELAKHRQEDIEKQLADVIAQSRSGSQAQVTLSGLEGAAIGYRKLYDSFLQQYMGSTQQATFPVTEARVISAASPPLKKSKPKSTLILALSLFGGAVLGFGLGLLRDVTDRVFRTASQIETELRIPCVALVPEINTKNIKQAWHQKILSHAGTNGKESANDVFTSVIDSPLSAFAEAIRSIKLTIDLQMDFRRCKVIGITSTLPNEGKSTIAAALALLIAQVGGRALLVDCDLRNPSLSRKFSQANAAGIFDVVSRKVLITEAIVKDPKSNLALLPAGKRIPLFLTSEILAGELVSKLFDALRQHYDYILVDLPPLAPIIDVRASTHFVDGYLLAVEWGRTKIGAIEQCLRGAPKLYESIIGAVLNKADMSAIRRYDSSGRYDRNDHYSRYGYIE